MATLDENGRSIASNINNPLNIIFDPLLPFGKRGCTVKIYWKLPFLGRPLIGDFRELVIQLFLIFLIWAMFLMMFFGLQ